MSENQPSTQGTVLVVDDEEQVHLLAAGSFESLGLVVYTASRGSEAIAEARRLRPDAIVLDLSPPDVSAFEVCRELNVLAETRNSPIAILVAADDIRSVEMAYQIGAADVSLKPPNWLVLAHRVRHLIRAARVNAALLRSEVQLANAQRLARLGWWEWDLELDSLTGSDEFCRILGVQEQEAPTKLADFLRFIHPGDRDRIVRPALKNSDRNERFGVEYRIIRKDREQRVVSQQAQISRDDSGRVVRMLASIMDVSDQKLNERRIHLLAEFDPITGLANRHRLIDRMQLALGLAEQHRRTLAVMFLGVDGLKRVNDSLGHSAGDSLLAEAGARLSRVIRKSDLAARDCELSSEPLVARFEGDEFAILLTDLERPEDSVRVAQRVIDTFSKPYTVGSHEVSLTASIGIAVYPQDGVESETLLQHADTAMYEVKKAGGNGFRLFTEEMNLRVSERLHLEAGLRRALDHGEFVLHYQAKMSVKSSSIRSAEALIRWNSPEFGLVTPDRFISVSEESGLIVPIGLWVLQEACKQLLGWHNAGLRGFGVAVNVSARQFNEPDFPQTVSDVISQSGVDPSCVELELTESAVMENPEVSKKSLTRLKQMGLRLAIDDFGTGYSSFGLLRQFPLDTIKIDRSLTQGIPAAADRSAITAAIMAMAQALGINIVAEGVENEEQMRFLAGIGCDEIQGYLVGRPVPPEEFIRLFDTERALMRVPFPEILPTE